MRYGPMTANECFEILQSWKGPRFRYESNTCARFTELRDMGLLVELGTRQCQITGQEVILWEINPEPPAEIKTYRRPKSTMEKLLRSLEERVSALEQATKRKIENEIV
jgi:hypothetical protein